MSDSKTIAVSVEDARESIIALTEMRGFVGAGPAQERDFMLPRIDRCVDAFGIADIVRRIHHEAMEGVSPSAPAEQVPPGAVLREDT